MGLVGAARAGALVLGAVAASSVGAARTTEKDGEG